MREATFTKSELIEAADLINADLNVLDVIMNNVISKRNEARKLTAKAQRERTKEILEAGRKALGLEKRTQS